MAAAVSIVLGVAPALAQDGNVLPAWPDEEPGRPTWINEYFARTLENGCDYRVGIVGLVRVMDPPPDAANGEARYSPRLNVGAELRCPDAPPVRLRRNVLEADGLTAEAFVRALEQRTEIDTRVTGPRCRYMPNYQFQPRRLAARSLTYACGTARGGGPLRVRTVQ